MPASKLIDKKVAAICLTTEVEVDQAEPHGYRFSDRQRTTGKRLYSDERFSGIAAAMRLGLAYNYFIVGGQEDRYPGQGINRAVVTKLLLEKEYGAVSMIHAKWQSAHSVTQDVVATFTDGKPEIKANIADYVVVTNWYHAVRTTDLFRLKGWPLRVLPAEAFLLIEGMSKVELVDRFGGGDFAERCVDECHYFADQLRGRDNSIRT